MPPATVEIVRPGSKRVRSDTSLKSLRWEWLELGGDSAVAITGFPGGSARTLSHGLSDGDAEVIEALVCACLDVGSIRAGNIGWAVLRDDHCEQGGDLACFVDVLVAALDDARPLALGFECPLFIPARDEVEDLLRARAGEGNRSWSAGPGATVLAAGMAEAYWTLCRLHERCPGIHGTTRWHEFAAGSAKLLVFEAFVSSTGKARTRGADDRIAASPHERDAAAAARAFLGRTRSEAAGASDITAERVLSLAGLQLLASGLSDDAALLRESCIVVKTAKP